MDTLEKKQELTVVKIENVEIVELDDVALEGIIGGMVEGNSNCGCGNSNCGCGNSNCGCAEVAL